MCPHHTNGYKRLSALVHSASKVEKTISDQNCAEIVTSYTFTHAQNAPAKLHVRAPELSHEFLAVKREKYNNLGVNFQGIGPEP